MIDQLARFIGYALIGLSSLGLLTFVVVQSLDLLWRHVKSNAKFVDCFYIYCIYGRKAAKRAADQLNAGLRDEEAPHD